MESHLTETIVPRICLTLLWNSLVAFLSMAIKASRDNSMQAQRVRDVEQFAKDAELFRLRQQLQPHFLYNSLNSINALIGIQPEKAREMVGQLSDFLRSTVKVDDSQLSTLKEELEQLNLYLNIEKLRFGHRLQASISAAAPTDEAKLPALILQPLVENAIKYGLYDTLETVDITIEATLNDKQLVVSVCNPFDPVTSTAHKGTGFGLNGIRKRLYLLYGRNDLLTTTSENGRFCATVLIPQLHVQSDNN
nr:histidine kinase [Flavihumibacter rivuli]